jgi:hypothetical protein
VSTDVGTQDIAAQATEMLAAFTRCLDLLYCSECSKPVGFDCGGEEYLPFEIGVADDRSPFCDEHTREAADAGDPLSYLQGWVKLNE